MNNHLGRFDLAIVGAGILGLATARAAVQRGLHTVVIDRDAQANGASIRNFGFVTVSGQEAGLMWARARRTRNIWREVAAAADIPIVQEGLWVTARRPESVAVIEAFMATDMAEGCRILTPPEARRRWPALKTPDLAAVLESTLELRIESKQAIPLIAAWLAASHEVNFMRGTAEHGIEDKEVRTSRGRIEAEWVAVCPGDDFTALYGRELAAHDLTRCKLQMMRLADPGVRLPGAMMSDLGLARYLGFSRLAAAAALKARLLTEQSQQLRHGVHLIVVQSADGSLIVGDSHEYATTPDPFSSAHIDALILEEFEAALGMSAPRILERWTGTYAAARDRQVLMIAPAPSARVAIVTCGAGASTAFALGEEIITSLLEERTTL